MEKKPSYKILGIDPGTVIMGYAIIEVSGQTITLLEMDSLPLRRQDSMYARLQLIYEKVTQLFNKFSPNYLAIESQFFGKNIQSMLKLGRAQGVAIAAAMQAGLEVYEYTPKKIKQAITGNGNADKEQLWKMLQQLLQLDAWPPTFDASDALAVAICHQYQLTSPLPRTGKKASDWKTFIRENKDRLIQK